jgi:hypothetical protein
LWTLFTARRAREDPTDLHGTSRTRQFRIIPYLSLLGCEQDFLQENDRISYGVSAETRKVILRRLLAINHQRHEKEVAAGVVDEKGHLHDQNAWKSGDRGYRARIHQGAGTCSQLL